MIVAIGMTALLVDSYSHSYTWFVANPIGSAIGQLLSPLVGDSRQSVNAFVSLSFLETYLVPSDPCARHRINSSRAVHPTNPITTTHTPEWVYQLFYTKMRFTRNSLCCLNAFGTLWSPCSRYLTTQAVTRVQDVRPTTLGLCDYSLDFRRLSCCVCQSHLLTEKNDDSYDVVGPIRFRFWLHKSWWIIFIALLPLYTDISP